MGRFHRNAEDNIIFDAHSGLMWQDEAYTPSEIEAYRDNAHNENIGKVLTWEAALEYAKNLRLGGFDDWRLPTKEEFESILDTIKTPVFKHGTDEYFRTQTRKDEFSWVVYMTDGGIIPFGDDAITYYVRCVRTFSKGS